MPTQYTNFIIFTCLGRFSFRAISPSPLSLLPACRHHTAVTCKPYLDVLNTSASWTSWLQSSTTVCSRSARCRLQFPYVSQTNASTLSISYAHGPNTYCPRIIRFSHLPFIHFAITELKLCFFSNFVIFLFTFCTPMSSSIFADLFCLRN